MTIQEVVEEVRKVSTPNPEDPFDLELRQYAVMRLCSLIAREGIEEPLLEEAAEALSKLEAAQNGPPLLRQRDLNAWKEAMASTRFVLTKIEERRVM